MNAQRMRVKPEGHILMHLFVDFLKKKRLWYPFLRNHYEYVKRNRRYRTYRIIEDVSIVDLLFASLKTSSPLHWISTCFSWDDTIEQGSFWYGIYKEWLDITDYRLGLRRLKENWTNEINQQQIEKIKEYYWFEMCKRRGR